MEPDVLLPTEPMRQWIFDLWRAEHQSAAEDLTFAAVGAAIPLA